MTLRILFAEPDDVLCEIYAKFFSRHGHDVLTATGGCDCIEKIATFDPAVLILDDDLQWGGAAGVLAWLRDDDVSFRPIVLVTGDSQPQQLSNLLQLPAARCFMKPVSLNRLLEAIKKTVSEPLKAKVTAAARA